MKLNLIYLKNNQNIIGVNNDLLFNSKSDLKHFKNITSYEYVKDFKNIVIMGYNTWKSIPDSFKPLDNRINIIITKNHFNEIKNIKKSFLLFKSFEDCFEFLLKEELKKNMLGKKFIIGGSILYNHVYENYKNNIDIIYETYINCSVSDTTLNYSKINFDISSDPLFKKIVLL